MLKDNQAKKNNNNKKIYILAYPLQIIKKKKDFLPWVMVLKQQWQQPDFLSEIMQVRMWSK